MDKENKNEINKYFYQFMENTSGIEDNKKNEPKNFGFSISFSVDDKEGFVTRVEMPQQLSQSDLDLSAMLLYSIFSGEMESDAIHSLIKLYSKSPGIYEDCMYIINEWRNLKKESEATPMIKPTQTLKK